MPDPLHQRYLDLLSAHGVRLPPPANQVFTGDVLRKVREQVAREARFANLDPQLIEGAIQNLANSGDLIHRRELDEMVAKIDVAINRSGLKLDRRVYVGEFPTGSFNAQVQALPEGAMVLMNSGLFWLIYQAM